jgi:muramoyltetrapeptide carboxypeptidase
MNFFSLSLVVLLGAATPSALAQAGVGTACSAYGTSGTCQIGHQCGGNWFSSIAGAVQGCGPFAANVRCCVPACVGDNGLPGICANTCDARLPPQYAASGTGGCPSGSSCCAPSNLQSEVAAARQLQSRVVLPTRVKPGDTVMLVAPSSAIGLSQSMLQSVAQSVLIDSMGLKVVYGSYVYESNDNGRVAGTDAQRAQDVMRGFSDKSVSAIIAIGGGWGCARIVDLLDYAIIRQNPKPFMGYSDVTGCIAAIAWRAGITAHVGPLMSSDWTNGNGNFARRALFSSIPFALTSFSSQAPKTVVAGRATGRLVGGNLSVLSAMIGARVPLFPAGDERLILIIEDVGEEMYRVDRLLSTMELNGLFSRIDGFVFGTCFNCDKVGSVETVVRRAMIKHAKPAVYGVSFGHHGEQFVVPIGQEAILDADRQQLFLVRAATQPTAPSLSPYVARSECQASAPSAATCPPCQSGSATCAPCPQCTQMACPMILPCPACDACKCPDCQNMTVQPIIVTQAPQFPPVCPVTTCAPCTCPAVFCESTGTTSELRQTAAGALIALAIAAI